MGEMVGSQWDVLNVIMSMAGSASSELILVLTKIKPSTLNKEVLDQMENII